MAWVRRGLVALSAVTLVVVVTSFREGTALDPLLFRESTSGDGWALIDKLPTAVDDPALEVSSTPDAVTVSFAVFSGTGGVQACAEPIVKLTGIDRVGDHVAARLRWRERGCAGEWLRFVVELDRDVDEPFVFEWNATAEGECMTYRVESNTVLPMDPDSACSDE